VEEQLRVFNDQVLCGLQQACPLQRKGPKKTFITEDIWNIRAGKLRWRRTLKQLRRVVAQELLSGAFKAWSSLRTSEVETEAPLHRTYRDTLLCGAFKFYIDYRLCAKQLEQALKQAKHQGVADQIALLPPDAPAATILHTLRPLVGSSNLKNKGLAPLPQVLDQDGKPCTTPEAALERWITFFGNMEGGQRITAP
jgi:hypothetical protein